MTTDSKEKMKEQEAQPPRAYAERFYGEELKENTVCVIAVKEAQSAVILGAENEDFMCDWRSAEQLVLATATNKAG